MKYLLPLLCCAAFFFGGRQFRMMRAEASGSGSASGEAAAKSRNELRGLARQAERLAGQDCTSAAGLKRAYLSGSLSRDEFKRAIRQAAESDPEGTWRWIGEEEFTPEVRADLRASVLSVWFARDPAKALAALSAMPSSQAWALAGGLIGKLGGADESLSDAVRMQLPALVGLLGGMGGTPPPRTAANAEILLSLADDYSRELLLGSFTVAWLSEDPAAAKAFLQRLPESLRQQSMEAFSEDVLRGLGTPEKKDARKLAMEWLLKEASAGARSRLGERMAIAMAEDDPVAALQWATKNLDSKSLGQATSDIMKLAVAGDPKRAQALVESLPAGSQRESAANEVAGYWVAKDPTAAITWWLGQRQGNASTRPDASAMAGVMNLGRTWYQKDPDSFRAWLADPEAPQLPDVLLQTGLKGMITDRDAAFEWIGSLPQAKRGPVVHAAYAQLAVKSPEEAASAYEAWPDLATGDSAKTIAMIWYGQDQQKAIGWVANLPWGGAREAALGALKKMAEVQVQRGGSIPEELKELLR